MFLETELKKPSSLPVKLISTAPPQPKYEKQITSKLNVFLKKDLKETPEPVATKPQTSETTTKQAPPSKEPNKPKPTVSVEATGSDSDKFFLILFWMLILTRLWMNMWILQLLLPIGFIMWLFKFLGIINEHFKICVENFLICMALTFSDAFESV